MVTLTGSPFKGNQLKAETGKIVHFWLLGEGSEGRRWVRMHGAPGWQMPLCCLRECSKGRWRRGWGACVWQSWGTQSAPSPRTALSSSSPISSESSVEGGRFGGGTARCVAPSRTKGSRCVAPIVSIRWKDSKISVDAFHLNISDLVEG